MENNSRSTRQLAYSITRAASLQTALTIHFLVDRSMVDDAYRAYAYFRWVDDWIDQESVHKVDRTDFIDRQKAILLDAERGFTPQSITIEEQMLVDLLQSNDQNSLHSGLHSYIHNMMAVMEFDAVRRGRLITKSELANYAHTLAVAVTEAMHYFIGHNSFSPVGESRYLAVTGAHITHMLRDTLEDNEAGYFNIPEDVLKAGHISPLDIKSDSYRNWVKSRVQLARLYFRAGRDYMARVENIRCRMAGYTYMARFESVLDSIERDDYLLRSNYPECKTSKAGLKMGWSTLWSVLNERPDQTKSGALTVR